MTESKIDLADLDANLPEGLWRWTHESECYTLRRQNGQEAASVWTNGCWHTWGFDGIGGENSTAPTLEDAMREALGAVIRQGWAETPEACSRCDGSRYEPEDAGLLAEVSGVLRALSQAALAMSVDPSDAIRAELTVLSERALQLADRIESYGFPELAAALDPEALAAELDLDVAKVVRVLRGRLRVQTALCEPDGDSIDVFVTALPERLVVSDLGQTVSWLYLFDSELVTRLGPEIDEICRVYGLRRAGGALEADVVDASPKNVSLAVARVALAAHRLAALIGDGRQEGRLGDRRASEHAVVIYLKSGVSAETATPSFGVMGEIQWQETRHGLVGEMRVQAEPIADLLVKLIESSECVDAVYVKAPARLASRDEE